MRWAVGDRKGFEHRFTEEQVNSFAKLVGDFNPVHLDANYSRELTGGEPVVHGMLAASFVSTLVGMHIPGPGSLWQSFQVNWRKMIRVGDLIRFDAHVTAVHPAINTVDLHILGTNIQSGEIHLDGKGRVMIVEKEAVSGDFPTLDGQRILVTGASGELGRAVCKELASKGAKLVLYGRREDRLATLTEELGANAVSCQLVDLRQNASLDSTLDVVLAEGPIFGFVHVASPPIQHAAIGESELLPLLKEQWEINVGAFYQIAQRLISTIPSGGIIVQVLTQCVLDVPPPRWAAYASAKMAAWGLLRSMALELGPKGIRCNAISPSLMNTPFTRDVPLRMKQVEAASNPLRRLCTVEDVAKAVAFLCGPEASYINGVNLPVTGGAIMP